MTKYYFIVMLRWGDPANHGYLIGITRDPIMARIMGKEHRQYRGGKYEPEIIEIELPEKDEFFVVEEFNGDRENLVVTPCTTLAAVEMIRLNKCREFIDVKKVEVCKVLSEEDMLSAHDYLTMYNNEEQEYLRDRYETYIRKKMNL